MEKGEVITILCATDNAFSPYYGIMLTSLFENNKRHAINVFILVCEPLDMRNARRFAKLEKRYGQRIQIMEVDDSKLRSLPLVDPGRLTIATYYRLLVTDLLPESLSKVLYLDGDIIVMGDLSELWETNLEGKALAAVPRRWVSSDELQKSLHYPSEAGYFNAGVLLINLDFWRSNQTGQVCLEFIKNHSDIICFHDQDVLNAVLWDNKIPLPLSYNFQWIFLTDTRFNEAPAEVQKETLEIIRSTPRILHYNGTYKPWEIVSYFKPYRDVWRYYKKSLLGYICFQSFRKRRQ